MVRALRLLILIVVPLLFMGLGMLFPAIAEPANLRWFATLFSIPWVVLFPLRNEMTSLVSLEGLSATERERLVVRVAAVQKRIWYVGGMSLFCTTLLLVLSLQTGISSTLVISAIAGVLVGIAASYIILAPAWHIEASNFVYAIKLREAARRSRQEQLARM